MKRWWPAIALAVTVAACSDGTVVETTAPADAATSVAAPATSSPTSVPDTTPATGAPSTTATETTTAETTTTQAPLRALGYEAVAEADFPIVLTARPGDDVALLAERAGRVYRFDGRVGDLVLDIGDRTTVDGERGLLGMARHPEDDGRLFVHYTDRDGDTVVAEYAMGDDLVADASSERILVQVGQPASNHNGGMIQFGPDGALYLGLGDGGGGGDPFGNGQNPDTLLGGIVRIDVETGEAVLWHMGLRNPWRFWIDGEDVWIGDVGQNSYEEVDLAPITEQGVNYGWPVTEGLHCYESPDCDTSGFAMPIVEVARGDGGACSITGGVVYRGAAIPELDGRFLFSDFCGGFLRSTDRSGEVTDHTGDVGVPGQVVSFGVDGSGEVYVLTTEQVLALVPLR
ncbi:MAG: PQQ-dependent sugar dehydrogenase [Actinomycetes bacterium]|nr:sugar dehydrogenase [Acidimicrobiia bacterium]